MVVVGCCSVSTQVLPWRSDFWFSFLKYCYWLVVLIWRLFDLLDCLARFWAVMCPLLIVVLICVVMYHLAPCYSHHKLASVSWFWLPLLVLGWFCLGLVGMTWFSRSMLVCYTSTFVVVVVLVTILVWRSLIRDWSEKSNKYKGLNELIVVITLLGGL
jgi:hypothetical protein